MVQTNSVHTRSDANTHEFFQIPENPFFSVIIKAIYDNDWCLIQSLSLSKDPITRAIAYEAADIMEPDEPYLLLRLMKAALAAQSGERAAAR